MLRSQAMNNLLSVRVFLRVKLIYVTLDAMNRQWTHKGDYLRLLF